MAQRISHNQWPLITIAHWRRARRWWYGCLGFLMTILTVMWGAPGLTTSLPAPKGDMAPMGLEQPTPSQDAASLVQMGKERYQEGQFAAAIAVWQQAVAQFAQYGDRPNQALVWGNLALAYQQLGQWAAANVAIQHSLAVLASPTSSMPNQGAALAQTLTIQGSLQLAQGQAETALATWQRAITLYQQLGDTAGVVRGLIHQSKAYRNLGLYARARTSLEQVSAQLQSQPDSLLKVAGLLNLGDALRFTGDAAAAERILQQGLAIANRLQAPAEMTTALISLGNTAYAQQQSAATSQQYSRQALDHYQQAAVMAPTPLARVQAQLNQLRLLIELERWTEAQALMAQIHPQLNALPQNRTAIYVRIRFAQSWLALRQRGQATSDVSNIATLLATAVQQAQALTDIRVESYATGYLGTVYEQTQQWWEAQRLSERALGLAQASNAADISYRWHWQRGRLFQAQGEREQAIQAYTEAVNTLNSIRNDLVSSSVETQFSFRESVEPVYRQFVGLLLQPSAAGAVSQTNLQQARSVIESLQLAELDNFFREACLSGLRKPVDRIDPDAAVIYPIILPDRLEVIVSLPNQPLHHYATPMPQAQLEDVFSQMRQSLRRSALEEERLAIASQVYDLLIRPALPELTAHPVKTLAFVLDGNLKNLPMAALYDGHHYLVEQYSLALTPGLQLLGPEALAKQPLKLLVGGLSEARQGFLPLPGVKAEVEHIRSELPAEVLLDQTFTRTALEHQLESTSFPIVHLATHGQFSSSAADTFVLTWDRQIDVKELGQLLRSREQARQSPIELLVLSACQTADGDKRAALGLAGVAVRSGARSTLATLWSVDDQSTSRGMTEFYHALAQPHQTRAEALRQAQLSLLHQPEFEHPYYWAPFVLIGNWL